jgi:hypothetical protein
MASVVERRRVGALTVETPRAQATERVMCSPGPRRSPRGGARQAQWVAGSPLFFFPFFFFFFLFSFFFFRLQWKLVAIGEFRIFF